MSLDPIARGLGAAALAQVSAVAAPRILMSVGRSGWVWGTSGPTGVFEIYRATVKAGTMPPSALLRMHGQWNKYSPYAGGNSLVVKFAQGANSVTIGTVLNTASIGYASFEHLVQLSDDLKWGFSYPRSDYIMGEQNDTTTVGYRKTPFISVANAAAVSTSPRAKGLMAFSTFSSPPTVETKLIDFTQDVDIVVSIGVNANERAECLGFHVEALSFNNAGAFYSPKTTLCPGDSLTEGTGATAGNDWVSALGKLRTGRPMLGDGLGGQQITQIVDRAIAYKIIGKSADMIIWAGINDAQAGADWWAVVEAQLDRLLAYRAPSARTIICNFHNNTTWNSTLLAGCALVNANMAAKYGARIVDLASVINGNAGMYADGVHLNDTGYAAVAAAISSKMTALGWG